MHDFGAAIPNPAPESYQFHPDGEDSTGWPMDNGDRSCESPAFLSLTAGLPVDESLDDN
jgi:hypothetical protein